MAADTVAKIRLALEGQPAVVSGLKAVGDQVGSLQTTLKGLAAGFVAGLSVAAFSSLIKGSIDSAAALHDLAIQSSTTVEALSGLAAVGKFSDQTADSIAGAMNKLTRNLASTTEESRGAGLAIQALGLSVSQFKQLRPEDQMQAVAKAMDGFADSADKSAIMMALYGKEGANMLPFMKDLAIAGELSAKVTTEQAAAADNLQDNLLRLRTSGEGWKKELALGMIPALDMGVQALLEVTNGTGGLRDEVKRLAADGSIREWTLNAIKGASYVIDAFEGVIRVIRSVGTALGGALAAGLDGAQAISNAFTRIKSGDLTGAWNEITGAASRTKTVFKEVATDLDKLWSGQSRGQRFRDNLDKIALSATAAGAAAEKAKPRLDFRNVLDKNTKAAQDSDSAFRSMMKTITERLDAGKLELAMGRELTEMEKFEVKVKTDIAAAAGKLTDAQRKTILATLEEVKAVTALNQLNKERRQFEMDRAKFLADQGEATKAMVLANAKLREEIDLLGASREVISQYEQAKVDATIATHQQRLAAMEMMGATAAETEEVRRQIAVLQERQLLIANKTTAEAALEHQGQVIETWKSIDKTAHDTFVNIFEGGAGTFKRLGQTLKAAVLDMLYQLTVKRWIISIGASITGIAAPSMAQAMGGGAGGAGGIGNVLSTGSTLLGTSMFGAGGLLGALGAGAGWLTGATTLSGALGAAGSLMGAGSVGAGLAMGAGALLPIALPLLALLGGGLFKKSTPHIGGAADNLGGIDAKSIGLGLDVDTSVVAAAQKSASSIAATLSALDKAFGGAGNIRVATGYSDDASKDGGQGAFRVERGGQKLIDWRDTQNNKWAPKIFSDAEAGQKEYAIEVAKSTIDAFRQIVPPGWAREMVDDVAKSLGDSPTLEQASQALNVLTASIGKTKDAIASLTTYMTGFAGMSGDAVAGLIKLAGGLDAFSQRMASYTENFYSEQERADLLKRQLTDQLGAVGLDLPATREAFRAEVEAQLAIIKASEREKRREVTDTAAAVHAATVEEAQARYNALMAVNAAFAELVPAADAAAQATESVTDLMQRQADLLHEQAKLQIDLMFARGDVSAATAARRALETQGYNEAELAIYDANQALTEQIALEKQRLELLRQQQSIQADLMEASGDIAGARALRRELDTIGFSDAARAIYDANAALREQIASVQQFTQRIGGISNSLSSLIQDGLLGNLSAADLGGRMADVVIGGVYGAMAQGFSQQITSILMNGLITPMVQAAVVGASVTEAVSRATIDKMVAEAAAVAQALGAVLSDPAFRAAMAQVQGIMESLGASIAPAQAYYVNYDTRQQMAAQAAQEAQRLADQQAQAAQRAADEAAQRERAILSERQGLLKQLLQLEGNTTLLRQMELEALDPSNRALQERIWALQDETAAAEKYKSAMKDAQDFLGGFTRNIEEFIFKVSHAQADAAQGYQMAAAKFSAQLVLARGGDRDAMGGITSYADTLISSIRRESTTGAEANLRIARVLGQLASLPKQISPEQLIVDAIASANTSLEAVLNTSFASLDANVDGLLTAGELAASGLATNTQISALMARVDANGDGMISKQELANSRLQTLATAQGTTNTNLGNVTAAQQAANTWLGMIQSSDQTYSLANVNAIDSSTSATVAAINKTNAQIGTFNRNYDNPVTAQFSADSPLYSIFKGIDETNTWLYKLHGLSTASIQFWIALLNNNAPVTVRSENRTPANGTVFAEGGYTGPGAKWEPAGVVHRGEVVWSQSDVARWGGPGIVDALRQGRPGYADGGAVAIHVPPLRLATAERGDPETQRLLREVLTELRAQRSDDRARHGSIAEPLQRLDRRGAKWDRDGLPKERTNEALA